jgi:Na+/proline symporter
MNTIIVPVVFVALMLLVALRYRRVGSLDEYTMGGRAATKGLVGSALFTLVGGGELITLVMLATIYGHAAISLFVGYAIGFTLLSYLAPRIREIGKEIHIAS